MMEYFGFCVEMLELESKRSHQHEIMLLQKLCLEFLVSCAEEHPSDVRKMEKRKKSSSNSLSFCEMVLPVCFHWMMSLEHDETHVSVTILLFDMCSGWRKQLSKITMTSCSTMIL